MRSSIEIPTRPGELQSGSDAEPAPSVPGEPASADLPLVAPRRDWRAKALWRELEPLLPGLSIEVVARTDSTNTRLVQRARLHARRGEQAGAQKRRASDSLPCLLVAEQQTRGRGRSGRAWHSERGASLTFSLMLPIRAGDWSGLSLAVGVALADALDPPAAAAPKIGLKWPNDLWLIDPDGTGRKLAGVLIESVTAGSVRMAIIGVGVNLLPQEIGDATTGFACLAEIAPTLDAPCALARIAPALARALLDFERAGFAPFVAGFARRDLLHGKRVVMLPGDVPAGIGAGVDASGALLLRDADGMRRIDSGEVSVRPARATAGGHGN